MVNFSFPERNRTQSIYNEVTSDILRTFMVIVVLLGFFSFLYYMKILLSVYFTNEHIRENSRYILFVHMLINDAICLLLCLLLMLWSIYLLYIPFLLCYILVAGTATSFVVTPYNLAVMSMERYVAIFFPLRHSEICSVHNTSIAIGVMWLLGFLPVVADITALTSAVEKDIFFTMVKCNYFSVTKTPDQETINSVQILVSLSTVLVILVITYIKIILAAKRCGSSASKASKTVLLHGFQLLLSMASLITSYIELEFEKKYVFFVRIIFFFLFICIPRFISPMIYGLRDEVFRKYIKKIHSTPHLSMAQQP